MWTETVGPALAASQSSSRVICHRRLKCFGVGESDLEAMLPDMIRRKREPLVGITVHGATITLRVTASGPNEATCRATMEPTLAEIRSLLGVLVFGEEDDELEHAVLRLLAERGRTLAIAEWATDGLVTQWLAEASALPLRLGEGRSEGALSTTTPTSDLALDSRPSTLDRAGPFRGSVVVRGAAMLQSMLHVKVQPEAAASADTASAMARAIQNAAGADFGLGIAAFPRGGLAVPTAATSQTFDMNGTLHVALACGDNVRAKAYPIASHPAITKTRSAKQVLNMVRLALLNSR